MAVGIDDLQVQTQRSAAAPAAPAAPVQAPKTLCDLKREMDMLKERELRMQAD